MQHVPPNRALSDQTFFVSAALKDRRPLFADEHAAKAVLDSWQFFRRRGEIELYGFVIMPDHVHLILRVNPPLTVSAFMRRFKDFVAHTLAQGPIWDKGYWSEIITSESMLIQKIEYMHGNPVQRGLAREIQDYPWSSAVDYYTDSETKRVDPWRATTVGDRR
jgi:putative transposase